MKIGWNPQMCDVLVPYYDNRVPCGMPNETGDIRHDESDCVARLFEMYKQLTQ